MHVSAAALTANLSIASVCSRSNCCKPCTESSCRSVSQAINAGYFHADMHQGNLFVKPDGTIAAIDFDDVMLERHYSGVQAYCQSKLAQIMFTFDLADEGATAVALHPATYMPTKMVSSPISTLTLISEVEMAGLTLAPSLNVRPPRLAEAPAALECRKFVTLLPGGGRELVVGEILAVQVRDGLIDPLTLRLDLERWRPVGRLFGNLYCRTRDRFELVRKTYRQWLAEGGRPPAG